MQGYDQWLTTDRMAEAAQDAAEAIDSAWADFVDREQEDGGANGLVPYEACEEGHPSHAVYQAWLALFTALDQERYRLEDEAMALDALRYSEEQAEWARTQAIEAGFQLDGGF